MASKPHPTPFTDDVKTRNPYLNEDGHEVLDDLPVAIPMRFQRRDNLTQQVNDLVQAALSRMADEQGLETFEESDDFDIGEDYDPHSIYEISDEDLYYDHRTEVEPGGTPPDAPSEGNGPEEGSSRRRQEPEEHSDGPDEHGEATPRHNSGGTQSRHSGKGGKTPQK